MDERPLTVWLVVRFPKGNQGEPWEIQGVFSRQEFADRLCLGADPQWGTWYVVPLEMNKTLPVESSEPELWWYRPARQEPPPLFDWVEAYIPRMETYD